MNNIEYLSEADTRTKLIGAGGLKALKVLDEPKDIINQAKERLFAA